MTAKIILYNADCMEILKTIQDKSVDAVITDPPYSGMLFPYAEIERICRGNIIVFCAPENQFFSPDEYLFWIKTPSTKNYTRRCGHFVEMILVKRAGNTFNLLHWSQMVGVYDDRHIAPPRHPYEKPLSLLERLVRIYTNPNDVVLDPFMGVGTTLLACANLGRCGIGIDTDENYYNVAKADLEKYLL